uniref:tRNA-t(6)A37 methylthiotransferase n=1 Tax=Panagrellus redivivus TaxID=6233 RepID=A0A7E4V0M1_PANRE
MCDIEDIADEARGPLRPVNSEFRVKVRSKKRTDADGDADSGPKTDSFLPWSKTVYLKTWGCSHNSSDSEYMGGLLAASGFKLSTDKAASDIWLLNSCTVKTPSETQLENSVREARAAGKAVIVAGCVSQAAPSEAYLKDVSIVGVKQIDQIVNVVEETLRGNTVRLLSLKARDPAATLISLPKVRRNERIEILAINSGCLNHCTYCKTKMARGNLQSYPLDALVAQARQAFEQDGCKELWLTSEDLGAWGRDIGMVLPDLLNALVEVIPDGCMMRLGMTNPPYILDHLEEIATILNHPRVYAFLHIPVQAGSNAVLDDMKREYKNEHFCRIVDYMKEHVPGIYIATDFICAFPTETAEDFEESLDLVRKYEFPSLFINQYYPRPGTPAARLKKINTIEARRRTAAMTTLFHGYRRYTDARIGEVHDVLINEKATDGVHYVGHNKTYEHLLVPAPVSGESLLGKRVKVRITETAKFYMKTVIVSEAALVAPMDSEKTTIVGRLGGSDFRRATAVSMALLLAYFALKSLFYAILY